MAGFEEYKKSVVSMNMRMTPLKWPIVLIYAKKEVIEGIYLAIKAKCYITTQFDEA